MVSFLEELSAALIKMETPTDHFNFRLPVDWLILTNGEAEPDDNIVLFGFAANKSNPTLVAKVPRSPKNVWMLKIEHDRLQDAWQCLGEQAHLRLPEPLAMLSLSGQPVLVMTYLSGISLLRTSQKRFWQNKDQIRKLFVDAARSLREMNEITVTRVRSDDDVPSSFLPKLIKFRELFALSEREHQIIDEIAAMEKIHAEQVANKVLLQGDFWHGNIVRGMPHGKLMFLDWQYSRWSKDVSLDVYMFLLAAALATASRQSDEERAEGAIKTLFDWQADILPAYLSAYGKPINYSLLPTLYGLLLCCIEKSVRSVIDFGHNQNGDLVWRVLFSKLVNISDESGFYDGI